MIKLVNKKITKQQLITIATMLLLFENILSNSKYIGLLILMLTMIKNIYLKGISKRRGIISISLLFIWTICFVFQDITISIMVSALFYYLTLILISLYGDYLLQSVRDIQAILYGLFFGILIVFLYSPNRIIYQITSIYNNRNRIYGSFMHPNSLGGNSVLFIILALSLLTLKYLKTKKAKLLIRAIVILSLLLYFSKSRGAILSLIVYLLISSKQYIKFKNRISQLIFTVLLISLILGTFKVLLDLMINDSSFSYRLKGVFNMKMEGMKILTGYGMVSSENIDYAVLEDGSMEISWLKLFYKNGLIGITTFVFLLLINLQEGLRILSEKQKYVYLGIYVSFIAYSFVESTMIAIFNTYPIIMWLLISSYPKITVNRNLEKIRSLE